MKLPLAIRRSASYGATLLALFAVVPLAFAQNAAPTAPAKPLAFEVVSIRPSPPGSHWSIGWQTTADGYRVSGQSMRSTIMMAYFPQSMAFWTMQRLSGAPPWLDDLYDIDARVSEADRDEWQKQSLIPERKKMLHQMLQSMLADRCRMVVHHMYGAEVPGYSLEPGKRGPHLTETNPGEVRPRGVTLGDGGLLVPWHPGEVPNMSFYGATMAEVAGHLSQASRGHPVQDHTGLTGRYNFVVNWIDDPDSKIPPGIVSSDDPDPLSHWNLNALGLRLRPSKVPVDTLVIDHIEKPSEN